jgi:hypothetical protein
MAGVRWRRIAWVVGMLAGAAVLVELAGGLAQSAGDELPADLQAVPSDSVGFLSVRLGDLWEQPAARELRQKFTEQLPQGLDDWRQLVGLPPGDIDRLTLVYLSFPPGPYPLFFVGTAGPLDRAKVLANVGPNAKEEKRNEHTLYVGPRNNAVHFLGDRAYVASSVEGVRELLERPAPKKPGPLPAALALAAGKHSLAAGLNPAPIVAQIPELPGAAEPFKPLLQTQGAALTVDLDKETHGELRLTFAGEADAKQAEKAVQATLSLARVGLGLASQQVQKDPKSAKLAELIGRTQADLEDATVKQQGSQVEVTIQVKANLLSASAALTDAVVKVRYSAARAQGTNNLKQIALAMHNYHDTNKRFPAQAVYSPDGKPLLSWRVLILPFVEQDNLYKQFHLDEPWDSEHNKKLLAHMPRAYALPGKEAPGGTETHYLGFVGKGAFFEGRKGIQIQEITDGTSNTILVVEAAKGVPWTKPEDLPFDPEKPLPELGGHHGDSFSAAFCDGSVHTLPRPIKQETLKALITRNGGEIVDPNNDK